MKRFCKIVLLFLVFSVANSAVLFEVKDNAGKIIMEVSDDGVRFFNPQYIPVQNEKDTLMVISATNIKALVRKGSSGSSSRDFDIAETGSVRKDIAENRLFKANDEGVKTYVGSEDSRGLARSFEVVSSDSRKNVEKTKFSIDLKTPGVVNDSTMLWYPERNAFRVGYVNIPHPDSVGLGSIGMGTDCIAKAKNSTAIGLRAYASGIGSLALGNRTKAKGAYSTTMGMSTEATGISATAMGQDTKATGWLSCSMGQYTNAKAITSFAAGRYNKIEGNSLSWVSTDPLFVLGNGQSEATRSNAFEVKKNGDTYIPSLYTTIGSGKTVLVDANGKLCVGGKEAGNGNSGEIEVLKKENSDLKARVAKLEALMEQMLNK